jgi:hypothetical protein
MQGGAGVVVTPPDVAVGVGDRQVAGSRWMTSRLSLA